MRRPSRREATTAALALSVLAVVLATLALRDDPGLNVPPLIALFAATALFLGAAAVIARAGGRERMATGFATLILVFFALVGGWIGFGSGERSCTRSIDGRMSESGGTECRVAFGAGAFITAGMAVLAGRQWWRARLRQHTPR